MARQLVEQVFDLVWQSDRRGVLLHVSPRSLELLGYAAEELVGRSRFELMPPAEAQRCRGLWDRHVAGAAPMEAFRTILTARDGRSVPVESRAVPLFDEHGALEGYLGADRDVMRRQRLAEAVTFSERAMLQSVLDSFPGVVFWKDRDGVYLGCNQAFATSIGLTDPSEVVGKTADQLPVVRDRADEYRANDRQVMEGGAIDRVAELPTADGRAAWFEERLVPLRDAEGRVVGVLGSFHDVTAHRQAQEDLRRERDFIDAILETQAALVTVLDLEGRIVRFNRAVEALTGYPSGEAVNRSLFDLLLPPAEVPQVQATLAALLAGSGGTSALNHWRTRSGELRLIAFANTVLREEGEPRFIISTGIDVTEQRQAEDERERLLVEVQRRAAELQSVLDKMVEGVFAVDPARRVTLVNEAGVQLFGLDSVDEVKAALSRPDSPLSFRRKDGTPIPISERPLSRALVGEITKLEDQIIYNRRLGSDRITRVSAAPIRNEAGAVIGAVAVSRDITELAELDRMKDEFIRVAAHELKTPVAIMKGYAQALLRGAATDEQRQSLEAIDRGADRIDGVIRDLLDISRLQVGHLGLAHDRVDLRELAGEVVAGAAGKTVRHRIELVAPAPAVVRGDAERLRQVIRHLVDNAVKYSPRGGEILVTVGHAGADQVELSVEDHGIGIPGDRQGRIFERFYRAHAGTHHDYGGLGVGLFIAREVVRGLGGGMWFESEEGKGSTFHVRIPAERGE